MKYKIIIVLCSVFLFCCRNNTKISTPDCFSCHSKETRGSFNLNAINEPCFDTNNTCQDYFRMIIIPPFDSINLFSISKIDDFCFIMHKKTDNLQWNNNIYSKRTMKYDEEKIPIATQQADSLFFLLNKIKFWEMDESDTLDWIDPVFVVCDVNFNGKFKHVVRQNFTDKNIKIMYDYITKIVTSK